MKRLLLLFGLLLVVLAGVITARTLTFASRQTRVEPIDRLVVDERQVASRLAGALRIPTISAGRGEPPAADAFLALHAYLAAEFPQVHASLEREIVNDFSLLYTWRGSEPTLPPLVLTAHLDVVPVDTATLAQWTHPPFAGVIAEGAVWGRGALDNKSGVTGILEAIERLINDGFVPRRPVILAFGHDEEIGGEAGAGVLASTLDARGIRPFMVLDEGGGISDGVLSISDRPVALIAVAEKGYLTLDLTVEGVGGHSSAPPLETPIGILSTAVARLEARPFPGRLEGPGLEMIRYIGPEMPLTARVPLANLWLFRPLVERQLAREPAGAASLRTTTAPTMLRAGVKDNVLPQRAVATVNFRIRSGESIASVIERVTRTVNDDRVQLSVRDGVAIEPSPVSPVRSDAFEMLQRTVHEVFPEAVVAPFTTFGATDARYYAGLTPHVYRLLPVRLTGGDLARIHGVSERVRMSDYVDAIRFYYRLIRAGAGA